MKKILFLAFFALQMHIANSQLLVDSLGNVGIQAGDSTVKSTFSLKSAGDSDYDVYIYSNRVNGVYINNQKNLYYGVSYGLRVFNTANHRTSTDAYGIHSVVKNPASTTVGYMYGVYGQASTGMCNYGVFGNYVPTDSYSGAGVCGSVSGTRPVFNGSYAGYFNGDVYVYGSISTSSGIYTEVPVGESSIENISSSSDATTVSTSSVTDGILSKLNRIDAVKYTVSSSESVETKETTTLSDVSEQIKYGLDVSALEEQFPELVRISGEGRTAIDYTGIIPLLLQAIRELEQKVTVLENSLSNGTVAYGTQNQIGGTTLVSAMSTAPETNSSISRNTPNPFNETSIIHITLPVSVQSADLIICDMSGVELKRFRLNGRGSFDFELNASSLTSGIYLYTLIADGKVIDTKRMVIAK